MRNASPGSVTSSLRSTHISTLPPSNHLQHRQSSHLSTHFYHHHTTDMVAEQSKQATGEIPSSGGSNEHSLESNTVIVVLGASGDLAKKKVSFLTTSL